MIYLSTLWITSNYLRWSTGISARPEVLRNWFQLSLLQTFVFCFAVSQEVHNMKVMVAYATCLNSHIEYSYSFILGINLLIWGHRLCITITFVLLIVVTINCEVIICSTSIICIKHVFVNFANLSNLSKTNIIVFYVCFNVCWPIRAYVVNNVPIMFYLCLYNLSHVCKLWFNLFF